MKALSKFLPAVALVALLAVPSAAFALGRSFGGRIVWWEPCLSPLGPAFFITIAPAGIFPISYIWAPGSLGLPPTHIGQQILGVADAPMACLDALGLPLPGQRIQLDGVSV
jgi:hypothetical protein